MVDLFKQVNFLFDAAYRAEERKQEEIKRRMANNEDISWDEVDKGLHWEPDYEDRLIV